MAARTIYSRSCPNIPRQTQSLPVSTLTASSYNLLDEMSLSELNRGAENHIENISETLTKSWEIKDSPLAGRGLFATRQIKKGQCIFVNKPLVVGPRADSVDEKFCCNCYAVSEKCRPCVSCDMILCSACLESPAHGRECGIICSWTKKTKDPIPSSILTRVLILIRSLLLNAEEQSHLCLLQSADFVKCLNLEQLQTIYDIPKKHLDLMKKTSSIVEINSFRIPSDGKKNSVPIRGLYPVSALLNHSCIPNTRNIFRENGEMAVYASKDIEDGEEILTCYTSLLWCTPARRHQLFKSKRFWCLCARCSDPTEKGTRLTALKCFDRKCLGVFLPIRPLDDLSDWKCDNCEMVCKPVQVSAVQSAIGSLLGRLNTDDLETMVLGRLANFVPFSSHVFVDLKLRLLLRLGRGKRELLELSESRLALKESLCRSVLSTARALGAGDAHLRGLLLYHLHAALAERARRLPHLYDELKPEIESTIEEAYRILDGDISAPQDLHLRRKYLGPDCDKSTQERLLILDP